MNSPRCSSRGRCDQTPIIDCCCRGKECLGSALRVALVLDIRSSAATSEPISVWTSSVAFSCAFGVRQFIPHRSAPSAARHPMEIHVRAFCDRAGDGKRLAPAAAGQVYTRSFHGLRKTARQPHDRAAAGVSLSSCRASSGSFDRYRRRRRPGDAPARFHLHSRLRRDDRLAFRKSSPRRDRPFPVHR
jgi:hypothetical protein